MTKFSKLSHKALAGSMSIWLSGIVFLFCCEMPGAAAEKEFCPLTKVSEHCDKAEKKNAPSGIARANGERGFDCCGFLPAIFDKSRKIEPAQKQLATVAKHAAPKFKPPQTGTYTPGFSSHHTQVLGENNFFVKHCVLRI